MQAAFCVPSPRIRCDGPHARVTPRLRPFKSPDPRPPAERVRNGGWSSQDFDAASPRLSTMQFDVVLVNVEPADDCGRRAVEHLQKEYPNTVFYSHQRIDDFFQSVGIHEGR